METLNSVNLNNSEVVKNVFNAMGDGLCNVIVEQDGQKYLLAEVCDEERPIDYDHPELGDILIHRAYGPLTLSSAKAGDELFDDEGYIGVGTLLGCKGCIILQDDWDYTEFKDIKELVLYVKDSIDELDAKDKEYAEEYLANMAEYLMNSAIDTYEEIFGNKEASELKVIDSYDNIEVDGYELEEVVDLIKNGELEGSYFNGEFKEYKVNCGYMLIQCIDNYTYDEGQYIIEDDWLLKQGMFINYAILTNKPSIEMRRSEENVKVIYENGKVILGRYVEGLGLDEVIND